MKINFYIAQKKENKEILNLLKNNPIKGGFEIIYQKAPNYFYALKTEGKFNQVLIGKRKNKIIAIANRSIKPVFINGVKKNIGYLGGLRIDNNFQGQGLYKKCFKCFLKFHKDNKAKFYLAAIIADSKKSKQIITKKRKSFPQFTKIFRYHTVVINLFKKKKPIKLQNTLIRKATKQDQAQLIDFLIKEGPKKQFFPEYVKEDFKKNEFLKDLSVEDFYIATKNKKIVGVLAKWDQSKFKQTIIKDYNGWIKIFKCFYNFSAKIFKFQPLPKKGGRLKYFFLSHIVIKNNNRDIFKALLRRVYNDNINKEYSYFTVGLSEKDPLLKIARQYFHISYQSDIYLIHFNQEKKLFKKIKKRIPYLELASL